MKLTKLLPLLALSLLLAGCGAPKAAPTDANKKQPLTTKILINELPLADRPFTVLVPHATNVPHPTRCPMNSPDTPALHTPFATPHDQSFRLPGW